MIEGLNQLKILCLLYINVCIYKAMRIWTQVTNEDGEQRWKRVEVRLEDHVTVPVFAAGMSSEFYDKCLDDYLSKIATEHLPQSIDRCGKFT